MNYVEDLDNKLAMSEGYQILSEIVTLVESDVELTREEAIEVAKMLNVAESKINDAIDTIVLAEGQRLKGEYISEKMLFESIVPLNEKGEWMKKLGGMVGKKKKLGLWKKVRGSKLNKLKGELRKGIASKVKQAKKVMKKHPVATKRTKLGLLGAAGAGVLGAGTAALAKKKANKK